MSENSQLILTMSTNMEEIGVVLIGNGGKSKVPLIRGFEKHIEPKLFKLRANFKLKLAITEASR